MDLTRQLTRSSETAISPESWRSSPGGYAGIGLETTRALISAGATVIVPARDREKAIKALGSMPGAELELLDLMDPESINRFAHRFLASERTVHVLINNAAIMGAPLVRDARGYESQFATNHLGHLQLTAELWPALRRADGARVVSVSSRGHVHVRAYDRWIAYGQSKSANALFAVALDAIGPEDRRARRGNQRLVYHQPAARRARRRLLRELDIAVAVPADSAELLGVRPWAIDPEFANRLWSLSERLTGVGIPTPFAS